MLTASDRLTPRTACIRTKPEAEASAGALWLARQPPRWEAGPGGGSRRCGAARPTGGVGGLGAHVAPSGCGPAAWAPRWGCGWSVARCGSWRWLFPPTEGGLQVIGNPQGVPSTRQRPVCPLRPPPGPFALPLPPPPHPASALPGSPTTTQTDSPLAAVWARSELPLL